MARPSDPVLSWLRKLIEDRGMNSAQVAETCGLPRNRLRRVLSGSEPMLLDEMMQISDALDIQPADMGLAEPAVEAADAALTAEAEADGDAEAPSHPVVDPYGNHPEQLFRVAFGLGCDFFFLCDASALVDSGVPEHVLSQYQGRELPIKLDATYHHYNDPQYGEHDVTLTLSFDQVYECVFPWSAVRQVIFFPAPVVAGPQDEASDEVEPARPVLRLVTD